MDNIVILDASRRGTKLDRIVTETEAELAPECRRVRLAEETINFCTGCWSCWWKTPGLCIFRDAMDEILPLIAQARIVLLATPVFCGLPCAVLKRAMDRTIPLVHPYIELHHGESHHRKRYAHYPDLALLCETADQDEQSMITTWLDRYSKNFHGAVLTVANQDSNGKEVAHALARP